MTPPGPVTPDSGNEPVLDDVQRAALKAFIGANGRSAGLLAAIAAVRPLIEVEAREDEQRKAAVYIEAVTADIDRMVAEIRAEERASIAAAIEAARATHAGTTWDSLAHAARIARGEAS